MIRCLSEDNQVEMEEEKNTTCTEKRCTHGSKYRRSTPEI